MIELDREQFLMFSMINFLGNSSKFKIYFSIVIFYLYTFSSIFIANDANTTRAVQRIWCNIFQIENIFLKIIFSFLSTEKNSLVTLLQISKLSDRVIENFFKSKTFFFFSLVKNTIKVSGKLTISAFMKERNDKKKKHTTFLFENSWCCFYNYFKLAERCKSAVLVKTAPQIRVWYARWNAKSSLFGSTTR